MKVRETNTQYFLRGDLCEDIHANSLLKFLSRKELSTTGIKEDLINTLNKGVNAGCISDLELYNFLDEEIRFGHNRTVFFQDIPNDDLSNLKTLTREKIDKLLTSKGWPIPKNDIVSIFLPEALTLCEVSVSEGNDINLTFVETIQTEGKNTIKRENNFYFVVIDIKEGFLSIRMRPRSNIVKTFAGTVTAKIKHSSFYHYILKEVVRIFGFEVVNATHFKTTLYKIGKELTEKGEEKWKLEVDKHLARIEEFSDYIEASIEKIDTKKFDLKFRLQRLLERALIQSNFKELKKKGHGKKGYVQMFNFSDKSGGKIKAQTKEEDRAIELAEIYYDTRDTIDKAQSFDTLWIYWFTHNDVTIRTKLEATDEFYTVHFYKYINKGDLSYVLSEISSFKKT